MIFRAKSMLEADRAALCLGAALAAACLLAGSVSAQDRTRSVAGPGTGDSPIAAEAVDVEAAEAEAADAAPAETAAEAPEPAVDPATVTSPLEAGIEFDRLLERQRLDSALEMGARMVELTERDFGRNHVETAKAYVRLADAQRRAREHDLAEASYHAAIEIYRSVDGPYSPLSIEPLTSLGDSYHEDREYLNAVSAYDEARTATRRSYGLLSAEQAQLLDRMAESLLKLNRVEEADERQLESLRLVERRSEPGSAEKVDALFKYAAWLRRTYRFQEERQQYILAMGEIEDRYGHNDLRLVRPLLAMADSYREQGVADPVGENALNKARALLSAAGDKAEPRMIAELFRDIGDWYIAFDNPTAEPRAAELYRRAWNTLGTLPDGEALRAAWFGGTNYVRRGPFNLKSVTQAMDARNGSVVVKFDLSVAGIPSNIEVIESNPPGLKDADAVRHIRESRFRPHVRDGELVPSRARALRFTFPYLPESALTQSRN